MHILTPLSDLPFVLGSKATIQVEIDNLPVEKEDGVKAEREKALNSAERKLFSYAVQRIFGLSKKIADLLDEMALDVLYDDWKKFDTISSDLKEFKKCKEWKKESRKYQKMLDGFGQEQMKSTIIIHQHDLDSKLRKKLLSIGVSKEAIDNGSMEGQFVLKSLEKNAHN